MFWLWVASITWACVVSIVASLVLESRLHAPDLIISFLLFGSVFLLIYTIDKQSKASVIHFQWDADYVSFTRFIMCSFLAKLIVGLVLCLSLLLT